MVLRRRPADVILRRRSSPGRAASSAHASPGRTSPHGRGFSGFGCGRIPGARVLTGIVPPAPAEERAVPALPQLSGERRVQARGLLHRQGVFRAGRIRPSPLPHMGCPLRYNPANRRWNALPRPHLRRAGPGGAAPAIRNAGCPQGTGHRAHQHSTCVQAHTTVILHAWFAEALEGFRHRQGQPRRGSFRSAPIPTMHEG